MYVCTLKTLKWLYSKCLKYELLKSKLVWNPNFCEFRFQTPLCLNRTVSKPNSYWVSKIHTSLDFRHLHTYCMSPSVQKLNVNKLDHCRLAQRDTVCFVKFFVFRPWFETRCTPSLFQAQIINLQYIYAWPRGFEKCRNILQPGHQNLKELLS